MNRFTAEMKVGIFVIIGIVLLFFLSVKFTKEIFIPKDSYPVYAIFENVKGLIKGAKVTIAGVTVGKVKEIELTPTGKAKVTLLIYKTYKIPKDSIAKIKQFGVLGDKYIEIELGTSPTYLQSGDVIAKTASPVEFDDLLTGISPLITNLRQFFGSEENLKNFSELIKNFNDVSKSLKIFSKNLEKTQYAFEVLLSNQTIENLNSTIKNFKVLSKNLQEITNKINQGEGTLGKLVTDDSLYVELKQTLANLQEITNKINQGEGTLGKLVTDDSLYAELKQTVNALKTISQKIEKGEGTLGKLVTDDSLYVELKQTVNTLKIISQKIEKGEGALGKLVTDESLYVELKQTLADLQKAINNIEDQLSVAIIGAIVGGVIR